MSRLLADPLYERLLNTYPATQAYTRSDWADDTMPGPVAHFLRHLLNHHSRREARRLRRARTDWVDYDHPEMETAVQTFFDTMEAHTRVPADEWEPTLRRATHSSTAHLVRPVHVLTDFVYAERQKKLSLSRILRRMRFFGPYSYLREAVEAFAEKHDLDTLGPDRFERFLNRIDERITDNYDADRWVELLRPLFDVADHATGQTKVPTELLQTFFAEKGRKGLEWQLEAYADDGHEAVSPRVLRRLIAESESASLPDEVMPELTVGEQVAASPEREEPDPVPSSPESTEESEEPEAVDDEEADDENVWGVSGTARPEGTAAREAQQEQEQHEQQDDDQSEPLWKRFQKGRSGAAPDETSNGAQQASSTAAGENDAQQEPLWARFQQQSDERLSDAVSENESASEDRRASRYDASESAAGSTGPDASDSGASEEGFGENSADSEESSGSSSASSTAVGGGNLERLEQQILGTTNPSHRGVYVRQLFGGDQHAYKKVLHRLTDADSWNEASQIIAGDIFRKHKVNIYSDAAVHFTNAVEDRFRQQ